MHELERKALANERAALSMLVNQIATQTIAIRTILDGKGIISMEALDGCLKQMEAPIKTLEGILP